MKCTTALLLMAMLALGLMCSQKVYCQPSRDVELKGGTWSEETNICEAHLDVSPIVLEENVKFTLNLIISRDIDVRYIAMWPSPTAGNPDVTVYLGSHEGEPIAYFRDTWVRQEFTQCLKELIEGRIGEDTEGYAITVPLIFVSQKGGTIQFREFTIRYKINPVEELEEIDFDPEIGKPVVFHWKPGIRLSPRYEIEVRSSGDFLSSDVLLHIDEIGTYHRLTGDEKEELYPNLDIGSEYSWGVRVVYGTQDNIVKSPWKVGKFIPEPPVPPPVELSLDADEDRATLKWDNPENIDSYETNLLLLESGEYKVTVWTLRGDKISQPAVTDPFKLAKVVKLGKPENLRLDCKQPVVEEDFIFMWNKVEGAERYTIEILDSEGESVAGPIEVLEPYYNPWDTAYGEKAGLDLESGETYKWTVKAKRGGEESENHAVFYYQLVPLRMLTLVAAFGGLLGGFMRIAKEEKARTEKRSIKIYKDYQVYIDLVVGGIIGIIFYLMVNETLSDQLNPLKIPTVNYAGSLIIGFLGGLISYELTRLKRAALPPE